MRCSFSADFSPVSSTAHNSLDSCCMRDPEPLPRRAGRGITGGDKDDEKAEEHPLTERIQGVIGEKVEGVRPSKRLTDSPACLVLSDFGMGIQMRKILEASGQSMPEAKPFFEFNAEHPLLHRLDTEQDEDRFAELVELLFDQASLAEGGTLQDPATYVSRMNRLLMDLLPASDA